MGLLHSPGQESQPSVLWELQQLAQAAGVPLPPPLTLPVLPPLVGGCNLQSLTASIGTVAARALGEQLQSPQLQGLLTGNLQDLKSSVLAYLATVDALKSGALAQLADSQGTLGALGQAQDLLEGVRAALDQPLGNALAGDVVNAVADACPVVGGLLAYAENTLSGLDSQLSGLSGLVSGLGVRIAQLTSVRALASSLLEEIEAHIDIQDTLFQALAAMDFDD